MSKILQIIIFCFVLLTPSLYGQLYIDSVALSLREYSGGAYETTLNGSIYRISSSNICPASANKIAICKYDANGNFISSTQFGGSAFVYARAIVADTTTGTLWIAGTTQATDFPVTSGKLYSFNPGFVPKNSVATQGASPP